MRPEVPAPKQGELPLPSSLEPAALQFQPGSIEDFNSIVPAGVPRLETPEGHPNVSASLYLLIFVACNGHKITSCAHALLSVWAHPLMLLPTCIAWRGLRVLLSEHMAPL